MQIPPLAECPPYLQHLPCSSVHQQTRFELLVRAEVQARYTRLCIPLLDRLSHPVSTSSITLESTTLQINQLGVDPHIPLYSPRLLGPFPTTLSMALIQAKPFRLALLQLGPLSRVKASNIDIARKAVEKAAKSEPKPQLIVLPEIWNRWALDQRNFPT